MCFLVLILSSGCREKGLKISVFDGLPESKYVSEVKAALENKTPMAISFTAEWCPHCRQYKPVFFEVKDELKDKALFLNIDVEDTEGSNITNRFQVKGIPTTAFIRADGSVFKVQVGEIEKEELIKIVNELVESKKRKRGEPIAPFPIEPVQQEEVKQAPKDLPPQELIDDANTKEPEKNKDESENEIPPGENPPEKGAEHQEHLEIQPVETTPESE